MASTSTAEGEKTQAPQTSSRTEKDAAQARDDKTDGPRETALDASKTDSAAVSSNYLERIDTRPDGSEYPSGLKLYLITLALCLGVFLMALDNSIIATAIPKITGEFNSLDDVGWYGSGECSDPIVVPSWHSAN